MFLTPLPSLLAFGRLRAQTPSGGSGPLRRASAPFAAKAAQGWRSPLRRRRQGLTPIWAVGPAALPCAGGFPPQRPPLTTRPAVHYPLATIPYPLVFTRFRCHLEKPAHNVTKTGRLRAESDRFSPDSRDRRP